MAERRFRNIGEYAREDKGETLVETVDSHTGGEVTRIIIGGVTLAGDTLLEKRADFMAKHDGVRLALTREPRGHRHMFCAVITEDKKTDYGLFFMDAARYPLMCGHGTIGSAKTWGDLVDPACRSVRIATPSGVVHAEMDRDEATGRVSWVSLVLDSAFRDEGFVIVVRGQQVAGDLVCVGGYFAMVAMSELECAGLLTRESSHEDVVRLGMEVIAEANRQLRVRHPTRASACTVDVTEFYWKGGSYVVYGDHHLDRSPCGTGTSAKMALLHNRGQLAVGESVCQEGPLGTTFRGTIIRETTVGDKMAIVPKIEASAHITGQHRFLISKEDPFQEGYLL